MADKVESQEIAVGDEGTVGLMEDGENVITKVMGSKTVSSKKTTTKKVMKTSSKSSSSSSSSSSKKTTTSSSTGSNQQSQAVVESSQASSESSNAVSEESKEMTESSSNHSTTSNSTSKQLTSEEALMIDSAEIPSLISIKLSGEEPNGLLTSDKIQVKSAETTLAALPNPGHNENTKEESASKEVSERKESKQTDTGVEESVHKVEDSSEQQRSESVSLQEEGNVSSKKLSKVSNKSSSKVSSTSSKSTVNTTSSKDLALCVGADDLAQLTSALNHKLIIHSSTDLFNQPTEASQPSLQILLPSHQVTTTLLTPDDLTPRAGWMGEISFNLEGFEKDSIDVQCDGFSIQINATKSCIDEQGAEKSEQYAKLCRLPESPIDASKISTSLFQDGVMTIIVPTVEIVEGEMVTGQLVAEAEKIQEDKKDFILTSDENQSAVVPASNTTPGANATDYSKAYCSSNKSVVVRKDGQTFSQVQISRTGEAAATVTSLTSLLPAGQKGVVALEAAPSMHFNMAGFEGESIEVCSDGKTVEVKAVRTSVDEQGAERKEEFSRVYELSAPIDPCQLQPSLSQDGVLSLEVDSEMVVKEGSAKAGDNSEEISEEMVKRAESRQAKETETGSEEVVQKQEEMAAQRHVQSVSKDGSMTSSKSSKSSSSSFSSSKVTSSSSTTQATPQIKQL